LVTLLRRCAHMLTLGAYAMANFIVWLIIGAIIGWLAGELMGLRESLLLNIVVGTSLAGLVLTPVFGVSQINHGDFSPLAFIVSLAGALVMLALVCLHRRRPVRA
jgi:uncharacterized membrane protein YeaQ/YmgE (transglycosylase-associated protein family)